MGTHTGTSATKHRRSQGSRNGGDSRVVAAYRARQEAGGTLEAIREADPSTVKGLAARQASLGVVSAWQRRHELAPVSAGAAALVTGSVLPGTTAAALAVVAGCQEVARRRGWGAWADGERAAAGGWAACAAGWAGAHMILPGVPLWQWVLGLAASTAVPSMLWWRAAPVQEQAPVHEASIWELALMSVLSELGTDKGPLVGARLLAAPSSPAPQVVTCDVRLGYGVHADDVAGSGLQRMIESRLQIPTRGGLQIDILDTTTLRITASWSQALSSGDVLWEAKGQEGQAWLGLDDSRQDIYLQTWARQKAGRVRVFHGWLVGRTGAGKSTTLVDILLPDQARGWQLLLIADGAGDSLLALEPYAARYARYDKDRWEQVITLAWAIMKNRQIRGWPGPSPTDPIIRLVMDEATTIKAGIDPITRDKVAEIGRMGERFGVSSIQGLQNPIIEDLIGEGGWRNQTRWVIGHVSADPTYSSISSQSSNEEVSLLGLETGRAAIISEGKIVARRAKMAYADADRVAAAMRGVEPAVLHTDDMSAVQALWDLTDGWPTYEQEGAAPSTGTRLSDQDLRLSRWSKTTTTIPAPAQPQPAAGTPVAAPARVLSPEDDGESMSCDDLAPGGGHLRLIPSPAPITDSPRAAAGDQPRAVVSPAEYSDAREWMLLFLSRRGPHTVAEMADQGPYSRSTLFDAARALVANETLTKHENRYHVMILGGSAPTPELTPGPVPGYGTPSPYAQGQH